MRPRRRRDTTCRLPVPGLRSSDLHDYDEGWIIIHVYCAARGLLRQYSAVTTAATSSRIPVDIRRFPWIKPFVADYAFDYAKVSAFFAGDPREARAWHEAIARTQAY